MKVALYAQTFSEDALEPARELLSALEKAGSEVLLEEGLGALLKADKQYPLFNLKEGLDRSCNLMISIGGDGTILRAITYIRDMDIPLIGVNTGRLGFLSTFPREKTAELVAAFQAGAYKLVPRSLVTADFSGATPGGDALNFALNEVTVSRKDTTSMITIDTYLDGEYLTSYWADGLIVATPTGSTGYSLSCGGPVITPSARSLVITPIAPHNLNARPLVISDETEIRLTVSGREPQHLVSLDSRISTVDNGTEIRIRKAAFNIAMVEFTSESFFKTIRNKLLWGEDRRN
ncbi:NAD+ kinase [Robiginitalea myxolifaciens]|uniref:NAD kinase n=1 Tax=Robiginitalea myxolifaciens TaxID=400055 RepID=A0A1I6FS72_9FLAO|nr:NAD kinase [Robiginitalea myxolifaciens]SFR32781.1 NAD+ kinase [Robiginitalea myxolifaciens]